MAVVQGIREKVHLPIYDSISVDPKEQLRAKENSSVLKFFVNVQGKTKLETNLQSASLLPHYNTFEARAMRVVISDLPPEFPDDKTGETDDLEVSRENQDGSFAFFDAAGALIPPAAGPPVTAQVELGLDRLVSLFREAEESEDGAAILDPDDDDVEIVDAAGNVLSAAIVALIANQGGVVTLSLGDIEEMIEELDKEAPPQEQLSPNNGSGTVIGKFIYNTVTTFLVGEKTMISMPTWFFPSGAGPYSETGKFATHGEPSPLATFKFAEPIFIDRQQNFRVEIEVPESETLKEIHKLYGPLNIWVVLDGYMTRDVQ